MPSIPIRAVLVHKQRRGALSKGHAAAREPAPLEQWDGTEMMAALRAVPRAASLARAQRALGRHYRIQLAAEDGEGAGRAPPGMRVIYFELAGDGHGMDFKSACAKALGAMRLAPKGLPDCVPLVELPTPSGAPAHLETRKSRSLAEIEEELAWVGQLHADILLASSARLEGLSLSRSCASPERAVRSAWL